MSQAVFFASPPRAVAAIGLLLLGCSSHGHASKPGAAGASSGSGSGGQAAMNAKNETSAGTGSGGSNASGGQSGARATNPSSIGGAGGTSMTPGTKPTTNVDGGVDEDGGGTPSSGAHATGPGDWSAGDYPPDLTSSNWLEISDVPGQQGNTRQYKVHVPPSYDRNKPTPVVFCIHGLGQDALLFCVTGTMLDKKVDEAGYIMIMPNGYNNSWNAGTCCGDASSMQLDDVGLFRAIFAEVGKHVNIDLDRVYATGLSNGGYMSYRLACDAADMFAAVAPSAAAIGINSIGGGTNTMSDFTMCHPSQPISVLDIHGTSDPLIPYSLQAPSLMLITQADGCGSSTQMAAAPMSAGDTTCLSYQGCPSGVEVTACSIQDGGHCWFGSPDCGTGGGDIGLAIVGNNSNTMVNNDAVFDFFARHHR